MLPKRLRLTSREDIERTIKARQHRFNTPLLSTTSRENGLDHSRIAVVTPKKLGTAVERNRLKRMVKAAFKEIYHKIGKNLDMVIFPKESAKSKKSYDIAKYMKLSIMSGQK